ncbi:LacI family DNA-binding transcriptional regulator [Halalkalibacterium halodurans]|jgi:LacI family repressor for deo operon, udp, cdd, tsx, nupC, and nupG|uniref:Transcriptional regulator n=1 Tax=Halalkalibacterium halodurans (strain ATCC BAA-125 / DSM 18197 / FERM 7344 / JCM 9153 / C-125) TaxID=272558 RepID=Q9KAH4_HALH5|nr:LacI family DNA-binding transcriptional regulator [Halalkalibacterium halodurans]MED3648123.1 LacI family DNA-binding transcriptional regulator [Halalkalibacterium halodurans]MED4162947.1 LacI family DNA-binding transcriptional regulator [Halalkalibacterium halodurans]MED4171346.1 LacI family DNA-binding transcriptional regulator [Halalkalibacterium halodurans]TES51731.1 LacI family transcriptional regulator [Halalkalibacterium halodurans]BAB06032.1 transcriptional regulator [Halalkalibacte
MKMSDVAKLANVSPATVSRVLSNPELVSKETRKKVLDVINQVNYKPHIVARQFRTQETKMILVVVPDITSAFFSKVLRGIEHMAIDHGYQVILGDTEHDINRELEYINLLHQKQVDGMVLLTARIDKEKLQDISAHFPMVLACEYMDGLDVPTVSIDNISSARKATEHLIQLGHKRIAHITGPMNIILSRDRLKGYRQAMLGHDIPIDSAYIQEGELTFESGYDQTMKLLALEAPPTAIFAFNDEIAMGAMKAAKDSGLSIPNELAIIGFDNIKMAMMVEPGLTTIDQPKYAIGKKAMELLLKQINNESIKKKKFVLKDELIIRQTCGAEQQTVSHV